MNIPQIIKLRDAILAEPPSPSDLRKDSLPTYLSMLALLTLEFPEEEEGEKDARPILADMLDIDPAAAEALMHPVNIRNIRARNLVDVLNNLLETGEVNWTPGATGGVPSLPKAAIPAAPPATATKSLPLSTKSYSGRPSPRLTLLVILGHLARMEYEAGERDEKILASLGAVHRRKFSTIPELNSYIQGVEDATGYLDALMFEV